MPTVSPKEVYGVIKDSLDRASRTRMEHDTVSDEKVMEAIRKYVASMVDELARNSSAALMGLFQDEDVREHPKRLTSQGERFKGIGRLVRSDGKGMELGLMDILLVISSLRGVHTAHTGPLLAKEMEDFYATI